MTKSRITVVRALPSWSDEESTFQRNLSSKLWRLSANRSWHRCTQQKHQLHITVYRTMRRCGVSRSTDEDVDVKHWWLHMCDRSPMAAAYLRPQRDRWKVPSWPEFWLRQMHVRWCWWLVIRLGGFVLYTHKYGSPLYPLWPTPTGTCSTGTQTES